MVIGGKKTIISCLSTSHLFHPVSDSDVERSVCPDDLQSFSSCHAPCTTSTRVKQATVKAFAKREADTLFKPLEAHGVAHGEVIISNDILAKLSARLSATKS